MNTVQPQYAQVPVQTLVYAASPYAAAPTVVVQQQQSNPDQDYMTTCAATCCCVCLGCIMYCIKPNFHSCMGLLGGSGTSMLITGIIFLTIAGLANGKQDDDCSCTHYSSSSLSSCNEYNGFKSKQACLDAVNSAISIYNGLGAVLLVLGIILLPISIWRHSVAKTQAVNAVVMQQPMYVQQQPVYAQPAYTQAPAPQQQCVA